MYHAVVRRRARGMFQALGRGDHEAVVASLAPDVHHVFPGDHALGGERRTRAAVGLWLERLDRLFPGHAFTVHRVVSRGWPWRTAVAIQWTAHLRPAVGAPYDNDGAHWVEIRWGRVAAFHAYLDTQRVAAACTALAEAGVEEASAPPIAD